MWEILKQIGGSGDKRVVAEAILSREAAWDKMVELARACEGEVAITESLATTTRESGEYVIHWIRRM